MRPELGPYAAVDGLSETYWQSAPLTDPVGQWVEVRFAQPTPLDRMSVAGGRRRLHRPPGPPSCGSTAGGQSHERRGRPRDRRSSRCRCDGRPVDRVRVTVTGRGRRPTGVVALREISFPGVEIGRRLVVPEPGDADTTFVLRARPPRRGCIDAGLGVSCGYATDARVGEEESGMVREHHRDRGRRLGRSTGEVVARSTPATAAAARADPGEHPRAGVLDATGTSPALGAQLAFDGDPVELLGGRRRATRARPCGCAGPIAAS